MPFHLSFRWTLHFTLHLTFHLSCSLTFHLSFYFTFHLTFHMSFRQASDPALTNPHPGAPVPSQRETRGPFIPVFPQPSWRKDTALCLVFPQPSWLTDTALWCVSTALRPKRLTLCPVCFFARAATAAAAYLGPGMLAQPGGGGMVRTLPSACVFAACSPRRQG